MSRFLVCSSALLGKPGSLGATRDLRDCITGVATLLVCVLRRKATAMDSSAKNKPVILGCVFMECDVRRLTRKFLALGILKERMMWVLSVEKQVGSYR